MSDQSFLLYKCLNPQEEQEFRQWAKDNFDPNTPANPVWHPVIRDEWKKLQGANQ